jgi:transposase InsO family protein
MYLAAIIDWHSKAILSYKLSNSMDVTLVTDTNYLSIDLFRNWLT